MTPVKNTAVDSEITTSLGQQFLDAMTAALPLAGRNLMSIVAAAEILASGWVSARADVPDEHQSKNTIDFGKAFVASLNALLRECVSGNLQAYSPVTGLPLEIHCLPDADGPLYDHTCLVKIDTFFAWIDKNGMSNSLVDVVKVDQSVEATGIEHETRMPRSKVRVAWLIVLHANIARIDAAYGGKAKVLDAIKWLKLNGGDRIINKGYGHELFWIDDNDSEQMVKRKTVSTALSAARKSAKSSALPV